jgi:3-deoxy-D-manno-octulosonate 8-phosphate phosphatase (KDO 8-P phosphatase)
VTSIADRAAQIRLLILDVDGVLTDGSLFIGSQGESFKRFHVHDGAGIKAVQAVGIQVALVSARSSTAVEYRAQELNVQHLIQGESDKGAALTHLRAELRLPQSAVAAVGDDMADIPMLAGAGLAIAVANARPEVRRIAHLVTDADGGQGAVREVCDLLLDAVAAAGSRVRGA